MIEINGKQINLSKIPEFLNEVKEVIDALWDYRGVNKPTRRLEKALDEVTSQE